MAQPVTGSRTEELVGTRAELSDAPDDEDARCNPPTDQPGKLNRELWMDCRKGFTWCAWGRHPSDFCRLLCPAAVRFPE